jgi:hypothetical protein
VEEGESVDLDCGLPLSAEIENEVDLVWLEADTLEIQFASGGSIEYETEFGTLASEYDPAISEFEGCPITISRRSVLHPDSETSFDMLDSVEIEGDGGCITGATLPCETEILFDASLDR